MIRILLFLLLLIGISIVIYLFNKARNTSDKKNVSILYYAFAVILLVLTLIFTLPIKLESVDNKDLISEGVLKVNYLYEDRDIEVITEEGDKVKARINDETKYVKDTENIYEVLVTKKTFNFKHILNFIDEPYSFEKYSVKEIYY